MVTECQELYVTNVKACKNKSETCCHWKQNQSPMTTTILTSKHGQKTSVVPHSTEKHSQQIFSFSEHCSFHDVQSSTESINQIFFLMRE